MTKSRFCAIIYKCKDLTVICGKGSAHGFCKGILFMKKTAVWIVALALCLIFAGCGSDKTLSGVYETPSSTGSFVRYEFSEDGSVVCKTFMLDVKVKENTGSYVIEKGELILTYEGKEESVSFPIEDKGDILVINGNDYYKVSS